MANPTPPPHCFQWPYTLSPHDTGMILEDVWPTIFFGPERLPEMRRKAAHVPWAKELLGTLEAEAERVIQQPPQVPIEPAGWRHDFYSHTSGEHLLYDPDSSDAFLDPWDNPYQYSSHELIPKGHRRKYHATVP